MGAKTVKALLTSEALARMTPGPHFICADSRCDVVYYDALGACYGRRDVRVPVSVKQPAGQRLLCYCFGEDEASMAVEAQTTGRTLAIERVRAHMAAGRCACDLRNPRGICCLDDVILSVRMIQARSGNPEA